MTDKTNNNKELPGLSYNPNFLAFSFVLSPPGDPFWRCTTTHPPASNM